MATKARVHPAAIYGVKKRKESSASEIAGATGEGLLEGPLEAIKGFGGLLKSIPDLMKFLPIAAIEVRRPDSDANRFMKELPEKLDPVKLMQEWEAKTPEERQKYINAAGEIIGGGVGALAGSGPLSLPAAGGGAVLGKQVAQQYGPLLGGSGAPEDQTEAEFAKDIAKTFSGNAAVEGGGRLASAGRRSVTRVPSVVRNIVKMPFTPTAERAATNAIADTAGIELGLAERSGGQPAQQAAAALSYMPSSINTMHKGGERMMRQFEGALGGVGKKIHPSAVTPGDVSRIAKEKLTSKRGALNTEIDAAVPQYVSPRQAGEGFQASRETALGDLKKLGSDLYDPIMKEYGSAPIDMSEAGQRAAEIFNRELQEGAAESIYPKNTVDQLRAIGALKPRVEASAGSGDIAKSLGVSDVSQLPPHVQKALGITMEEVRPSMTLEQIRNLRTALLEQSRKMQPNAPSLDRRSTHELIDILNQSVEKSNLPPDVLGQLSEANRAYSAEARRLFKPESRAGDGNLMADIGTGVEPELIPGRVARPGGSKRIEDAMEAARPSSGPTAGMEDFKTGALHERYIEPARADGRVSPSKIAEQRRTMGPDAESALFGPAGGSRLDRLANEGLLEREAQLYDSPMSKQIESFEKKPQELLHQLAAEGHPEKFTQSVNFLEDQGDALKRGFYDDLLERAQHTDRTMSDLTPVTSPIKLENLAHKAGGSMDVALGGAKQEFDDLTKVGRVIKQVQEQYGNPSGTARVGELLRAYRNIASNPLVSGPASVATLGVPYAMARGMNSPKVAKFLTSPLERVKPVMPFRAAPLNTTIKRVPLAMGMGDKQEEQQVDWNQFARPPQAEAINWDQFRRVAP